MAPVEVIEAVNARSLSELRTLRDRAAAPLVELRIDGVEDIDIAGALEGRKTPVIVTCRPAWEGGKFDGSEEERLRLLADAIRLGAEYIDVEWRADRQKFRVRGSTKLVLSNHDFAGVPSDLAERVDAMRRDDADIVKIAVTPRRLIDCLSLRTVMSDGQPQVAIAMGPLGQVTRLCPWLFGSCWTYGGNTAPGQTSARDLIDVYRVPRSTAATKVYAITGAPLAHSASPAMHNAAFRAAGLDAVYVSLETADADELLTVAAELGVGGVSVTAPLKPALFARVVEPDALSRDIGAVNTLRRREGEWEGRNFDASGFLSPLTRGGRSLRGIRAVVMGAGGTARTVSWALSKEGAHVEVAARRFDRGQAVAAEFGATAVAWPPAPGWDLLVNTTPVGTWPNVERAPIDRDLVRGRAVYDLVYNPRETTLLAWAREAGAEVIGGLEMLVGQACHQFEWWTGRHAPASVMAEAAEAFIAETRSSA